jgi:Domain of unknown function (DUF4476)
MKCFKYVFPAILALFISVSTFAQISYGNNNGRNSHRLNRQCTEPFAMKSFNRDYAGISSSNYYHLDKEVKDYTRMHCLTAEQVRRLAILYPTDREKYDYLVYSLTYVFDIENYALAGSVLANRNARDGFYRFLVREGVPAGDYYSDPYYAQGGYPNGQVMITTPPQYFDRFGNPYNNRSNNVYDNRNNPYDNNNNNSNNDTYNHVQGGGQLGVNSGYRGLLTYKEFEVLKDKISRNTFDKGKLDDAKSLTRENTLTANQVAEISRLFNYSNRLEFAKFAFDYAYDRENYVVVSEVMAFEVNKKDLMRFVESRKRN